MILKQFDQNKKAIINPEDIVEAIDGFPEIVVSCFERSTFSRMVERYKGIKIGSLSIANLEVLIYKIEYKGLNMAIFNSYVGSPGCVGLLEELHVMGMRKLILFGTCGILNHDIDDVSIIIPDRAVRDEGTSYHYVSASNEIDVNINTLNAFEEFLTKEKISYTKGKVWTTDAMYRETKDKMNRRRDNSCRYGVLSGCSIGKI
ncbi:nucleoside phosphorylase [Senegalia massiliensis]|uniref:nucleoside phosphorylase n=1 Tax=Senegalia massiliensis TaxID=1720316 RepID=UPI001A90E76E|nr:nucleoside phosphorylase [Senegalia massiliensis]